MTKIDVKSRFLYLNESCQPTMDQASLGELNDAEGITQLFSQNHALVAARRSPTHSSMLIMDCESVAAGGEEHFCSLVLAAQPASNCTRLLVLRSRSYIFIIVASAHLNNRIQRIFIWICTQVADNSSNAGGTHVHVEYVGGIRLVDLLITHLCTM